MSRRNLRVRDAPERAGSGTILLVTFLATLALLAIGFAAYTALRPKAIAPLSAPVDPRYPDLSMGELSEVSVGVRPDGRLSVRFPAMIVNLGEGAFLLTATRPHPFTDEWTLVQRVQDENDLFSQLETDAALVWGGDGHDHWHVRHVESHRVETMDGEVLGEVVKAGFCFFDTDHVDPNLPGSPERHHYGARGCGGQLDLESRMGLSVGWGDNYPWQMLDQTVVVDDLPDGHYVIRMIADPFDWFMETDETNNEVATEIAIGSGAEGARTVEIVGVVSALPTGNAE